MDILEFSAAGFKGKKIRLTKENIYQINLAFNYKPTSFDDATGNGHIGIETLQKAIDNENLRKIKDYSRYS